MFVQPTEFLIELYDRLPWSVLSFTEPVIRNLKILLFFFSELRVHVLLLHVSSEENNGPWDVLYIGHKRQLQILMDLLGSDNYRIGKSGTLFFWQIIPYLNGPESRADLVIININSLLYRYIKPEHDFRTPDSVKSVLELSGSFDEVRRGFSDNIIRKMKNCSSSDHSYKILHDEPSLKHFYHEMYVPYIKRRFTERAVIDSYYKTRRLLRTGFLLAVQKKRGLLSGAICRIRNDTFVFELVGIEKGDITLLKEGALDLLYYYSILVAIDKKCSRIDFGKSRPFLNDGLVQYKKKWGTKIFRNPKQCREIAIRMGHSRKAARAFFSDNYPILLDNNDLSGLVLTKNEDPLDSSHIRHFKKAYYDLGLKRLFVCPSGEVSEEAETYCSVHLQDRVRLISMTSGEWNKGNSSIGP